MQASWLQEDWASLPTLHYSLSSDRVQAQSSAMGMAAATLSSGSHLYGRNVDRKAYKMQRVLVGLAE